MHKVIGQIKNIAITDKQHPQALEEGVMFDGSAVKGFAGVEPCKGICLVCEERDPSVSVGH